MRNLRDKIYESFFSNVGADKFFSKNICNNTYKKDEYWSNFIDGDKIFIPSASGKSTKSYYKIKSDGPYSIKVYDIKGLGKIGIKNGSEFILDFTPFIDKIKSQCEKHNDSANKYRPDKQSYTIDDYVFNMYPYDWNGTLHVELHNPATQLISFTYYPKSQEFKINI